MVNRIELKANEKSICIQEKNMNKWCEVSLITKNKVIILGYENMDIIQERFNKLFSNRDELKKTGEFEQKDIHWLMSLNEIHHSIYISFEDKIIYMYIENDEGNIIEQIKISQAEQQKWKNIFVEFQTE